ncbi:hypothetical protein [Methylobacterium oryzihabitans]|uniref:Uncharacterized protein n=1 Tax=Methylobacterium oryzihabitans TaxID=2499852 RepID=A0A437NYW7_9HYPH|nr:hypothetical protein [Methylobacterium oryzihabitans]RVU15211.1 hypothetical protein EOE48_20605 [Methylobacterium oryzihabitans]
MLTADLLRSDAEAREAILATLATQLADFRVPGGDVRLWLSEVTTLTLRQCLTSTPGTTARRLLVFTGLMRRAHERETVLYDYECDLTHVVIHPRAQAAVKAWALAQLAWRGEAA